MRMNAGQIHDAASAIGDISERPRVIPQIAKFKLARMHQALRKDFVAIELERAALVQTHGEMKYKDEAKTQSIGWGLFENDEGFKGYIKDWNVIRERMYDVNITPITLQMLGNDPKGLEVDEFARLGPLVIDASDRTQP